MSKLSKEELLGWLDEVLEEYTKNYIIEPLSLDAQAYQQIKEMLQKPEVTEEWIEKKANQVNGIILKLKYLGYAEKMRQIKDFIRSLVEEIK